MFRFVIIHQVMNTLATKETLEENIFEFIDGLSGDQFETTTLMLPTK